MTISETGVVLEARGPIALVRAEEKGECAGCGAKGHCHGGAGGEKTVEALNDAGARPGDRVVITVPSADFLRAAFQVYMVPVLGILAGAAAGQLLGGRFGDPGPAGSAAGIGGLAGAILSIAAVRLWRRANPAVGGLRPRVAKIL